MLRIVPQSVPASYSQFPVLLALPAPRIAGLLSGDHTGLRSAENYLTRTDRQ